MARVEDDSSESDEKLSVDGDAEDANLDVVKDDSDDESITSEDEDDIVLEEKVTAIQEKILENPYVYKNHIELLSILQQLGNRSRLRSVYERLSDLYPLASKQWLSWLQMEVASVTSPEGREQIYKLFDNAFLDCYSASIYMEWCAMSMGGGKDEARSIIPQALEASGSDPMDGAMLWDTAKEFEFAHLSVLNSASALSSADYADQVMRVFDVFSNQLSRPLFTSEKTLEEFRTFAESMKAYIPDVDERVIKVEKAHETSEKILKELLDFENELEVAADNETEEIKEKCCVYKKYISHVKKIIDDYSEPNDFNLKCLINVLYDRATSECSAAWCRLDPNPSQECEDLCLDYVEFAREYYSDEQCLKVIEKVIKRCPRNHSLWITKLHHIERMGHDLEKIKSEFETALYCGFHSAPDYVTIWLCYLETLRRKTDFTSTEEVERLRKTFRLSWDNLGQMWGDTADTEFSILQFWARTEYQHTKDYEYGKELFDEIFEYGDNRLRGGLWLEFLALERQRGGPSRARACLRRAVRNCADPRLQRAWLALERDHGSLDTLIECNKVCAEKAREWEEQQAKIKSKDGQHNFKNRNHQTRFQNQQNDDSLSKSKQKKKRVKITLDQLNEGKGTGKRPNQNSILKDDFKPPFNKSPGKKRKIDSADADGEQNDNNSYKIHKEDNSDADTSTVTGNNAKRKLDSDDMPSKRLKPEDKEAVSSASPPGYEAFKKQSQISEDEETNNRTAFISNLDFRVDENELRTKLGEYGDIEEMRLIKGVKTFGSICYCVYKDPESVLVALSHDRALLGKRPMFISRYCSTKDSRQKHFLYPTGIERNKLFVKNIAFDHCTEKKLTEVFQKYGELKEIRIVSFKNGNPKGLAYVEYADEKSANVALQATDGLDVGGRPINVALSAPPPKKREPQPSASSHITLSATRSHSRTMLFVPSVLQKPSTVISKPKETIIDGSPVASNKEKIELEKSSNLSNSDFRNMLLSKK